MRYQKQPCIEFGERILALEWCEQAIASGVIFLAPTQITVVGKRTTLKIGTRNGLLSG